VYAVGSNVYAATAPTGSPSVGGGVSVSTNGGATFTNATTANGLATNFVSDVYAIGNTVYAASVNFGSDSGGLGISTNGGTSFINSGTASGLGSTNVQGIYAVGNTIYAATRPSGGGGGLSISTNGGASYTTYTTANGLGSNSVRAVYVSGSNVYAATNPDSGVGGGVSISTDGGVTYTNSTSGLGSLTVRSVYASGSNVYAATNPTSGVGGGLSVSTDGGATFTNFTTANGLAPPRKPQPAAPAAARGGGDSYDSYEARSLGERCIIGFGRNAGPPMFPNGFYNNNYHIVQSPDAVMIEVEMNHDARIIRLNSKHRTDNVRPYFGDAIGWWEGDTLVVETTHIPRSQAFMGSWENLKVTERFTRVADDRLHYRFSVEDPTVWNEAWGGEYEFSPLNGQIYEYACHEGNYSLPGILMGARVQEAAKVSAGASAKAKP
jgi:hypothetical protein